MSATTYNIEKLFERAATRPAGTRDNKDLVSTLARSVARNATEELNDIFVLASSFGLAKSAMDGISAALVDDACSFADIDALRTLMLFCAEENMTRSLAVLLERLRPRVSGSLQSAFFAAYAFALAAQNRPIAALDAATKIRTDELDPVFAAFALYAGVKIDHFSSVGQSSILQSFDTFPAFIRDWTIRACVSSSSAVAIDLLGRVSSLRDLESFLNEYFVFGDRSAIRDQNIAAGLITSLGKLMEKSSWKRVKFKPDLSAFGEAEECEIPNLNSILTDAASNVLIRSDIAAFSSRYIVRDLGGNAVVFGFSGPGGGFYVQIREGDGSASFFEGGRTPDNALAKRFAQISSDWISALSGNGKLTLNINFFRLGDSLERSAYYLWAKRYTASQERNFCHRILASVKENFIRIEDIGRGKADVHPLPEYLKSSDDYANAVFFRNPVDRRISLDCEFVDSLAHHASDDLSEIDFTGKFVIMVSIEEEKRSFELQWQAFRFAAQRMAKAGVRRLVVLNSGMTSLANESRGLSEVVSPNGKRLQTVFSEYIPDVVVLDMDMKSIYDKAKLIRAANFYISPLGTAAVLPAAAGIVGLLYGNRHYSRDANLWSKNENCFRIPERLIRDTNSGDKAMKFDLNQSTSYTTDVSVMQDYLELALSECNLWGHGR